MKTKASKRLNGYCTDGKLFMRFLLEEGEPIDYYTYQSCGDNYHIALANLGRGKDFILVLREVL